MKIIVSSRKIWKPDIEVVIVEEYKQEEEFDLLRHDYPYIEKDAEYVIVGSEHKLYYFPKKKKCYRDSISAYARLARILRKHNFKYVLIKDNCMLERELMLGLLLGNYKPTYIGKDVPHEEEIKILYQTKLSMVEDAKKALNYVEILANSINTARTLVNTPTNLLGTSDLATWCSTLPSLDRKNLTTKTLSMDDIVRESMLALYEVGKGSKDSNPPYVVCMEYIPKKPKMRIAIVGKGVVYDTGGLSIKPSDSMATMKMDKAGAVATRSILDIISNLQLENVEVIGVVGIVENSISNRSYRPGDIVYSKSHKTIEITNTDAEGRLVLADCLTYVQEKYQPDIIIDIATLTGACKVGLGPHTIGVFGTNRVFLNEFRAIAWYTERCESIELDDSLDNLLDSKIADMVNCSSSRYGGAITAGLFLKRFIDNKYHDNWIHIDICGPAYTDSEWDYHPSGATGAGILSIVEYIKSIDRKTKYLI